MKSLGRYISEQTKRSGDTRRASIVSRNTDGTYDVKLLLSGDVVRASKANPVDEFVVGTYVELALPSASGNVIGSTPVIISRAPQENRGLSGTAVDSRSRSWTRAVVESIDPFPVVLTRSGSAVAATIYGVNLTESPVATDGNVTVSSVSVAGDGLSVSFQLTAGASALDSSSITIHGVTLENAIRAVDAPAATNISAIVIGDDYFSRLWFYETDFSPIDIDGNGNNYLAMSNLNPYGITADANYLYFAGLEGSQQKLGTLQRPISGSGLPGAPANFTKYNYSAGGSSLLQLRCIELADSLIWTDMFETLVADRGIQALDSSGGSSETKAFATSTFQIINDGTYYWINGWKRWTRSTDTTSTAAGGSLRRFDYSGSHLFGVQGFGPVSLIKRDRTALTDTSQTLTGTDWPIECLTHTDGNVYALARLSAGGARLYQIEQSNIASTLNTLDFPSAALASPTHTPSNNGLGPMLMTFDDSGNLYVIGGADRKIRKIDTSTLTVSSTSSALLNASSVIHDMRFMTTTGIHGR